MLHKPDTNSIYDFNEYITLYRPDTQLKMLCLKGLRVISNNAKANFSLNHPVPHIKAIWYLPAYEKTKNILKRDHIIDMKGHIWNVFECRHMLEQNIIKIKSFCETLIPKANDCVNIYRISTSNNSFGNSINNDSLIYSHVPAILEKHHENITEKKMLPVTKGLESIVMFIDKNVNLYLSDVIVYQNNRIYEITEIDDILLSPSWQIIKAVRKTGLHGQWTCP
ncbi:MAG: hypothetical protein Q4C95_08770 [Planctomycetia bacterium]|nr:hypothetical protein [Planctomycetia bacterium]